MKVFDLKCILCPRTESLSLGAINILDWIIFICVCGGGGGELLSCALWDACLASTYWMPVALPLPPPQLWNEKCLQTLSNVPYGAKLPPTERQYPRNVPHSHKISPLSWCFSCDFKRPFHCLVRLTASGCYRMWYNQMNPMLWAYSCTSFVVKWVPWSDMVGIIWDPMLVDQTLCKTSFVDAA